MTETAITPWSRIELRRVGREDPGGQAQQDREQHGREGELDSGGEQLLELGEHPLMGDQRASKIAVQNMGGVGEVLDIERPVVAVFVKEQCVPLGRYAAFARERLDGVAGHRMDQQEGEQGDPDEGRDHQRQPGEDETQHGHRSAGGDVPCRPASP